MAIQTLTARPTPAPGTPARFQAQTPERLIAAALQDTFIVRPTYAAPRTYRVAKGDTIERIARKTGVSVATLERLNPEIFRDGRDAQGRRRSADGWWIYPGDVLKLSTGTVVTPPKPPTPKPPVTPLPPAPSPEAIALTKARQTIDKAAISVPPTDFNRLLTWIDQSARTLETAQAALVTLEAAAAKGMLPASTFTRYRQKVDTLFETYATYMTGITVGSRTYGPNLED